jgi:hypothetical protein
MVGEGPPSTSCGRGVGIETPRHVIALIVQRLRRASEDYKQWLTTTKTTSR